MCMINLMGCFFTNNYNSYVKCIDFMQVWIMIKLLWESGNRSIILLKYNYLNEKLEGKINMIYYRSSKKIFFFDRAFILMSIKLLR